MDQNFWMVRKKIPIVERLLDIKYDLSVRNFFT